MDIKQLAQLAGVSTSTVSKIVNGKDEAISESTRKRVLDLVKQYHYVPYAKTIGSVNTRSFFIGVLLNGARKRGELLAGILAGAEENAYTALVCDSGGNPEMEERHLSAFIKAKADCVLFERSGPKGNREQLLRKSEIPCGFLDFFDGADNLYGISPKETGAFLTNAMLDAQHESIACVLKEGSPETALFAEGFRESLYARGIPFSEDFLICARPDGATDKPLFLSGYTGFVCFDELIADQIFQKSLSYKQYQSEGLAIICADYGRLSGRLNPAVARVPIPEYEIGFTACLRLIAKTEKRPEDETPAFSWTPTVYCGDTLRSHFKTRENRIVVVGSIHNDLIVDLEGIPRPGKTVNADKFVSIPGGKGTNQAVGAALLGADVALIGRTGSDYQGRMIVEYIAANGVDIRAISCDKNTQTGCAFIQVYKNADSSITIYPGANRSLLPEHVRVHGDLFSRASYCLIQSELLTETVEEAAKTAKQNGCKVVLKPSTASKLDDGLLKYLDYLIPNEKEMETLCPQYLSVEERAEYFLSKGVGKVIVTLAEKGCYLCSRKLKRYFPAADFTPVDTTGASDAFISALIVSRSNHIPIEEAIRRAGVAAGFVITQRGLLPALPRKSELELYFQ